MIWTTIWTREFTKEIYQCYYYHYIVLTFLSWASVLW